MSPGLETEVRDRVTRRHEYADAGIPEYWLADPVAETVLILVLRGDAYVEHGAFAHGQTFTSPSHEHLTVDVTAVFDAE